MLSAWCELRGAFRNFRLDRVDGIELLDERFADEPGKTVQDFLRRMTEERGRTDG
jgi:predicted DNA-binding transcriptional regulator YafY